MKFARLLVKRVEDEKIRILNEELALGTAIKTIDDYRERLGALKAYTRRLDEFIPEAAIETDKA